MAQGRTATIAFLAIIPLLLFKEGESLLLSATNPWLKLPSTLLFIALVLLVLFPPPLRLAWSRLEPLLVPATFALFLALDLAAMLFQGRHFARFDYRLEPAAFVALALISLALFALTLLRLGRTESRASLDRWLLLGAALTAAAYWAVEIIAYPLHPLRSNMLPVIRAATETLLTGGSPYRLYEMAGGPWPLNYLPALWLPYLPLSALGLDPRWLSLPSLLAIPALLSRLGPPERSEERLALMGALVLNPYIILRHEVYTYFFLALLAAFCLLLLQGRWVWASLLFGLCLASRQTMLPLLPFYGLTLYRERGLGAALRHAGLVSAMALALILPFALWDWEAFRFGVFEWFERALEQPFEQAQRSLASFSLSILFFWAGWGRWLHLAQGAALLLLFGLGLVHLRSRLEGLRFLALAFLAFILLNPVIWTYLFLPLVIFLSAHVLARPQQPQSPDVP